MDFLENIDIDINKGILKNIDIDKILYWLEFGITNRATDDGFNHVIKSQMIKSLIWDLIQMRNLIINSDGLWWPSPSSDHITKSISSLLSSHLTKLTIGEGWESFQRIWFCASSPVDLPKLGICSNWLRERFLGGISRLKCALLAVFSRLQLKVWSGWLPTLKQMFKLFLFLSCQL